VQLDAEQAKLSNQFNEVEIAERALRRCGGKGAFSGKQKSARAAGKASKTGEKHKTRNGRQALCVTTTPTGTEVWCCTRDEGGPLEVGNQVQASNRCKLRPSRAAVVSVAETSERDSGRYDPKRRAQANRR